MALPELRRFGGQQQESRCRFHFLFPNIFGKFRNILPRRGKFCAKDDGYGRKCCGYIYYVKLVTNTAANSSRTGDDRTAVYGQKENMGKGEYGKGTFRADQFCILDTLGQ